MLRKQYIWTIAREFRNRYAVSTLPDPKSVQRPSLASQATESLVIEVAGADHLPVRRKGRRQACQRRSIYRSGIRCAARQLWRGQPDRF